MTEFAIGIDMGGTEIKAAALGWPDGQSLDRRTAPTRDGETIDGEPAFLHEIRRLVEAIEGGRGATASVMGLSAPGLANQDATAIGFMPGRLRGLEKLNWAGALNRPSLPVLNDAHAALMGELWLGAARGLRDIVMFTLGTGVGGAFASCGRLITGHLGRAGHLGHLSVDFNGSPDVCGIPGSIEDAIGDATVRHRTQDRFLTTHDLVRAYAAGDLFAEECWLDSIRALAATIAGVINVLDPQAVLLGGGITASGEHLFQPLRENLDAFEWRPAGHRVEIRQAQLGIWAGACGAAYYAHARQTLS